MLRGNLSWICVCTWSLGDRQESAIYRTRPARWSGSSRRLPNAPTCLAVPGNVPTNVETQARGRRLFPRAPGPGRCRRRPRPLVRHGRHRCREDDDERGCGRPCRRVLQAGCRQARSSPGRASGMTGFRGGRIRARRPRLRDKETGRELPLPGREEIGDGGCPEELVISPMLMNGQAGTFRGGVRLKEAGAADDPGSGRSRSAVSRRHRCRPRWPRASPAVVEGAAGRPATVQASAGNLVERGPDPSRHRLPVPGGARAPGGPSGRASAIRRCRVRKERNIIDRLPGKLHAGC